MKMIYYHLYRGISKIDMDKDSEWKAMIVLSVLLTFNFITLVNIILAFFQKPPLAKSNLNVLFLFLVCSVIMRIVYVRLKKFPGLNDLLNYYSCSKKHNTVLAKSITIFYVIGSFIFVFLSTDIL